MSTAKRRESDAGLLTLASRRRAQTVFMSLFLIVCGVMTPACAETVQVERLPDAHSPGMSPLLEELDRIRTNAGIASVGIALVSRDEVIYTGGLGVRRHGSEERADEHTWYRLGSITKSFVGLTALRMQQDVPGLLDVPVNTRLPKLLDSRFDGDAVTLTHLLEHTAGLGDLSRAEFDFQGETVTFEDAISVDPSTRTLRWPAARHASYSNAGYGYAGYLLETIAGRPFESLVRDYVLAPAGMRTAGFFVTKSSPPLAAGYDTDGVTPIPYWHMLYRSFGGLNATPNDMGQFVHKLLQNERPGLLLTAAERSRFENPRSTLAATTGLEYGYGLGNYHWLSDGVRYHGHGGDADGYLSHYGYSNETGYGYFVVVTAFNHKPLKAMRDAIEQYLATLPALESSRNVQQVLKPVRLSTDRLSELAGDYVEVTRRFGETPSARKPALTIAVSDGQLVTRYRDRSLGLVAVSQDHFRRPWQSAATYAFIEHDGYIYLQGDMGNFRTLGQRSRSSFQDNKTGEKNRE